MPEGTYVSVMAQYFPTYKAKEDRLLNRQSSKKRVKGHRKLLIHLRIRKWVSTSTWRT